VAHPSGVTGAVSRVARGFGTSAVIPRPPNTQSGHVTVAFLKMNTAVAVTSSDWSIDGFSEQPGTGVGFRIWRLWRRDTGTAGPFTVSWTGDASYSVSAVSYQNVLSSGNPIAHRSPATRDGGPLPNIVWSQSVPYNVQNTGTITVPAQHLVQGRLMVAWVFTTGIGVSPPAGEAWGTGWNAVPMDASYTSRRTQVLFRRVGFNEAITKTWTFPSNVEGVVGMAVINGVDGLTPFGAVVTAESPEQVGLTFPATSTTEPNSLVMYFGGKTNGYTYASSDITVSSMSFTTAGAFGRSAVMGKLDATTPGNIGTKFVNETLSGGTPSVDFGATVVLTINPSTIETTSATTTTALGFDTTTAEQTIVYAAMSSNGLSITAPSNFTTRAASGTNNFDVLIADYAQPAPGPVTDKVGTMSQADWAAATMISLLPEPGIAPPAQPTGLLVQLASGSPQATWDTVTGATGYYIYRDSVRVTPSPVTTTTWIDTGTVTPGVHSYQVSALNSGGEGPQSGVFNFNMPAMPGPTPIGIIGPEKDRGWITGLTNGQAIQVRAVSLLSDGTKGTPTEAITLTPQANAAVATESYRNAILSLPNVGLYLVGGDSSGSDTVADYSVNNTPGNLEGTPTLGAARLIASDPAPSIQMDGIDDYITMGDRFDFSGLTPFFVAVTFRPTTIGTTFQQLAQKSFNDASSRTQGWQFGFSSALGVNGSRIVDSTFERVTGTTLTAGTTYRAIFTYDGAQLRIYLNGTLVGTAASASSIRDTITDLRFGFGLNGLIGHIGVGQAAITQAQVTTLEQNARHGDDNSPAAPVGVDATVVTSGVQLTWSPSTNIDHKYYIVEKQSGSTWVRVLRTDVTNVVVPATTSESFRVYDEDTFGNLSAASAIVTAEPTTEDPTPPTVSGARSLNGNGQVTLDWDDSTFPNFANYRVYQQSSSGAYPSVPTYSPAVSQQTVAGLTNGVTYRFRVTQLTLTNKESTPVEIIAQPQAPVTGTGGLVITNGQLRQTNGTKKLMLPKTGEIYGNSQVTIRHGDTAALNASDFIGAAVKVANDRSKMLLGYIASDRLYIASRIGSTQTVIDSKPLSALMLPNQSYWLLVNMVNDFFSVAHYLTDPQLGLGNAQDFLTRQLTGVDNTNFGNGITGQNGIYLHTANGFATRWVDDFKTNSVGGSGTNALCHNTGNFPAEPLIELTGPMTTPEITNLRNNQVMRFTGDILQGEKFFIDVASRSVVDQDNESRMSQLGLASDWIELEPGMNELQVSLNTPSLSTAMSVSWRNSWL
jgi:hypothetical protein